MIDALEDQRPYIELFYQDNPISGETIRYLSQGIEEEGIPLRISQQTELTTSVTDLAMDAAIRSMVEVGIGMDHAGKIVLHYKKLPQDKPLFTLQLPSSPHELRRFGCHAARLVKGLPFRLEEGDI